MDKDVEFSLTIEAGLHDAFVSAADAEDKTAAQILRDFIRRFVDRQRLGADARRQSEAITARSADPSTDDYRSLREIEAVLDADDFADSWK